MSNNTWKKVVASLSRLGLYDVPHANQVASESVHGTCLAAEWKGCSVCLEENRLCKCGGGGGGGGVGVVDHEGGHHLKSDSSFAHSVINMVGMLIGLGQLSTPYALETGGWCTSFILIALGATCAYTAHLLGRCLDRSSKSSKTYQDIGDQAFGPKGRLIASTFIYLEIFLALVGYTISLSDNLSVVFSGARLTSPHWLRLSTPQLLTLMAVVVALPSLWLRDLSSISFLSFGGILMSMLIFATVCFTAVFGGVKADKYIPAVRLRNVPGISGLYIFSYTGHIVFPNIYTAMKDPSKFTKVSITSFTLVTALYTALAFIGAKLFGPTVNSQITLSMPRHLVTTKIALWATVLTPMTKYALEFAPFAIQLEHSLPHSMSARARTVIRGTIGSLFLLVILCLALTVPYFGDVLSLTGSLISVSICLVFPCAFYLKICWAEVSRPAVALNAVIIGVGIVFTVVGTVSSAAALVRSVQRGHSI
ncbi:hypothetical protein QJS10_CPB04g01837 [Acorus calamus]|uniref:Amino acid transporter transmembrane domain-containing protein n=1 Tax=Acorus calamus TaxID=4465 RepID=A0AAV9F4V9_ACOCL|nr:hypothetical protein QJS10_CPB04g01837 [Acorus calamus]